MLNAVIDLLIKIEENQLKPMNVFHEPELEKIKKKTMPKLKFKKKWFIDNWDRIYGNYRTILDEMIISGDAKDVYSDYFKGGKKNNLYNDEFYNFINNIYIDEIRVKNMVNF